jgi:predicted Zn-dependent peptidase
MISLRAAPAQGAWMVALALALSSIGAERAQAAEVVLEAQDASQGKPALILAPRDTSLGILFVRFHVGSFDDDQEYGRTRFTQRALVDANSALGASFLEDVYAANATLELRTGLRECAFVLTAPKASFSKLATRLLDGLTSPRLDKKRFDRARRLTLDDQHIGGGLDAIISMVAGEVLLTEVSKGGGDYRNPPLGDRASVAELKPADLERHAATFFVPANASIAAVGPLDKKLNKALQKLRGGKRNEVKRGDTAGLPRELERYAPREMHLHAQVLELTSTKDVAVARVLEALVYDRMMWRLRWKGVTYGPYVGVHPFDWLDLLVIFVPVSNSRERGVRVEPLLREYLDQLIVDVKDEDFIASREHVVGRMLQIDNRPGELAEALMRGNRRVSWHDDEVLAATRALTKEDFLAAVRQWLGPERSINYLFGRSRAKNERRAR